MTVKKFVDESKKTWAIAAPVIITAVFQFSISFISSAFAGHIGDLELAAVSVSENVLEGFVYGVMLGMGSALETLCGQAVGAGKPHMLGIYMQRSCIITFVTALCLVPVYVFASPLLQLFRQDKDISQVAGKFSRWVLPQVFAYAFNFPVQKFLQSQTKVWVMTIISAVAVVLHLGMNMVFVRWLNMGLAGVALAGNLSWWFIVIVQFVYVTSGCFPEAWTGFSLLAFKSLTGFIKLSLASAVMLCLELWYYTAVILMVGGLKNPKIAVDSISICMNFLNWALMIALGFNASVSVRVSNEIGAGDSKAAKYSVGINLLTSTAIALCVSIAICGSTDNFPKVFSHNDTVIKETAKLTYLLAATIFLNGLLPVLHGVVVGVGWQVSVAVINLACYYVLGLPTGALLGFKFGLKERGVWIGMLFGCLVQVIILLLIVYRANWNKEVVKAEIRMRTYDDEEDDRGDSQDLPADNRNNSRDPPADDLNNSRDLPADSNSTRS